MTLEEALAGRRSCRAFLPDPVPRESVARMLALAARAPSSSNMQPWRAHVIAGAPLAALTSGIAARIRAGEPEPEAAYRTYPRDWCEPYLARRRQIGWDLYALLGIARGDIAAAREWRARNAEAFGAPVLVVVTMDARLETGSWLDTGMFVQSLLLAARGAGYEACPMAAFAPWGEAIRAVAPLGEHDIVVCGVAIGRPDPTHPSAALATERADVTTWSGL